MASCSTFIKNQWLIKYSLAEYRALIVTHGMNYLPLYGSYYHN